MIIVLPQRKMWSSLQTFNDDLFAFSEIEGVRDPVVTNTPQSLIEWQARNGVNEERSVFDTPNFLEDVTYVVSGRGRGGISTIIRPGAAPRVAPNIEADIKKKLREIQGAGFSNELIEQTYRQNNTITGVKPANKLQPTVPSSPATSSSSSKSMSRGHTPVFSFEQSRNPTPGRSSPSSRSSSRISTASEIETKAAVEEVKPNPVPLSALLKRAKDTRRKVLEKPKVEEKKENTEETREEKEITEVKDNDFWWQSGASSDSVGETTDYCWRQRDIPIPNRYFNDCFKDKKHSNYFNIGSSHDFPVLK